MTEPSGRTIKDLSPDGAQLTAALERRSILGRVFLGLAVALAVTGGGVYLFKPDWAERITESAQTSRAVVPVQDERMARRFAADNDKVNALMANLEKEPCDKRVVFEATVALESQRATRRAADMLKGFADRCPESNGERYRASGIYYLLGDYDMAVKLSSDLIDRQPDAPGAYLLRAKSEQGLLRYAAAVDDYAIFIRELPDAKMIASEVFTRMSDSYEKLERPCEAIGPIQTYIAQDSDKRSTPALLKRIAALAAKGNCEQAWAKGAARVPRRSNGVSTAKVQINGVEGTFIVDTGASFVTLTKSFSEKAKPQMFKANGVEMQTANGTTSATLATVDSVKLAGLSASSVPAVIANKGMGDGIDGLLGMSFLSRFTVLIQDREIQLKAKTLGE